MINILFRSKRGCGDVVLLAILKGTAERHAAAQILVRLNCYP